MVVAVAIFSYQLFAMWPHTVDDAYISLRYAENWISGGGLTWNYGGAPVEGYSNFLWVMIMASYLSLGLEGIFAAKILGGLAAIGQLPLIYAIGREVGLSKRASSFSVLLYSTIPAIAFWAVAGLATSLFTLLFLVSIYLVLRENSVYERVCASISFGLFALTRHEGMAVFLVVVGVYFLLKYRSESIKNAGIKSAQLLFFGGFIYTTYFIWRLLYYGYLFPNTVYIKGGAGTSVITHPLQFVSYLFVLLLPAAIGYYIHTKQSASRKLTFAISGVLLTTGLSGLVLGLIITPDFIAATLSSDGVLEKSTINTINYLRILSGSAGLMILGIGVSTLLSKKVAGIVNPLPMNGSNSESVILLMSLVLVWVALSMVISSSMMHAIRFFHPVVPVVSILSIVGLVSLNNIVENGPERSNLSKGVLVVLVILLINPFGVSSIPLQSESTAQLQDGSFNSPVYSHDELQSFGEGYGSLLDDGNIPLGKWLDNNTDRTDYVALGDAGAIPYYCNCRVIDLIGLNSIEAAHGDRSSQDVLNKEPKFIILTGNSKSSYQRGGLMGSIYSSETLENEYKLLFVVDHSGEKYDSFRDSEYVYWVFVSDGENVTDLRSSMNSSLSSATLVLPEGKEAQESN
ncbi:ArnT family glycosyltransferase [Halopenitus sp. H-Gu1]